MKKLTVLYFAALRDVVETPQESIDVPDSIMTIAQFADYLEKQHPRLGSALGGVRFARNEEFVGLDEPIQSGDVLALIPPVQGG